MNYSKQQRLLPLDKECMQDKKIDYKLFSLLQSMSYLNIETRTRYVPKNHPTVGKITRASLLDLYNLGCEDHKDTISMRTLRSRINMFKGIGMVDETTVIDYKGDKVTAFVLLENYDTYQLIPYETLRFLSNTVNSSVIKIYAYLLNRHVWKQQTGELYSFTLQELALALGLRSGYDGSTKIVKDCLHLLKCIDLIHYSQYYVRTVEGNPSPRLRLVQANRHYKQQ